MWASKDHTDIITNVTKAHENDYQNIGTSSVLSSRLKDFVMNLYKEITKTDPPKPLLEMPTEKLCRYAYHLIVYRAALGCVGVSHSYKNSYAQFLKEDNVYVRGLENGNPFILKAHLIKLYNEIMTQPVSAELIANLQDTLNYINALDPAHYQGMRGLTDGYLKLITGLAYEKTASHREEDVKDLFSKAANVFQSAEQQTDLSCSLYADSAMKPSLPFANTTDAINFLEDKCNRSNNGFRQ